MACVRRTLGRAARRPIQRTNWSDDQGPLDETHRVAGQPAHNERRGAGRRNEVRRRRRCVLQRRGIRLEPRLEVRPVSPVDRDRTLPGLRVRQVPRSPNRVESHTDITDHFQAAQRADPANVGTNAGAGQGHVHDDRRGCDSGCTHRHPSRRARQGTADRPRLLRPHRIVRPHRTDHGPARHGSRERVGLHICRCRGVANDVRHRCRSGAVVDAFRQIRIGQMAAAPHWFRSGCRARHHPWLHDRARPGRSVHARTTGLHPSGDHARRRRNSARCHRPQHRCGTAPMVQHRRDHRSDDRRDEGRLHDDRIAGPDRCPATVLAALVDDRRGRCCTGAHSARSRRRTSTETPERRTPTLWSRPTKRTTTGEP